MLNLVAFGNSFFNYIVLLLIIVVVATLGFVLGRVIKKIMDNKKN